MSEEQLSIKELEALRAIRNSIAHRGKMPSVRDLMHTLGYKSPRSAALILESLSDKGFLKKKSEGNYQLVKGSIEDKERSETIDVPLIGAIRCGIPVLAEENIEAMIPVSIRLAKANDNYFLLRAMGDSMNQKGINDGDLLLIRKQETANPGDIVVALIDDEATVKEYKPSQDTIILVPHSTNSEHKPIILDRDFLIQGVVVSVIPNFS